MPDETKPIDAEQEVEQIIKTARTLGVEVDETDVAQWLTAMAVLLGRNTIRQLQ